MSYRFRIDIDGYSPLWCMDVTGIGLPPSPTSKPGARLPGISRYRNITLRKGIVGSAEALDWIRAALDGKMVRKSLSISLLAEDGSETRLWQGQNVWPLKYAAAEAEGEEEGLFEVLEFASEETAR